MNNLVDIFDMESSILSAEAIEAPLKGESRGAHYRDDYPEINNDELYNNIVKKVDDKLILYKKNLNKLDDGLFQLIQNKKDINTTKEGLIE